MLNQDIADLFGMLTYEQHIAKMRYWERLEIEREQDEIENWIANSESTCYNFNYQVDYSYI